MCDCAHNCDDVEDLANEVIAAQQKQIFDLMRERNTLKDQVQRYTEIIGFLEEQIAALAKQNSSLKPDQRWANFKPGDMK